MSEWYFEIIYFNNKRMSLDVQDGVITLATSIRAMTNEQALIAAESEAESNPLTKEGWFARVTQCDRNHAVRISKICKQGWAD